VYLSPVSVREVKEAFVGAIHELPYGVDRVAKGFVLETAYEVKYY
jgi:hypothetical protein